MAATPRLSLPFLSVGQAQKEFTHNEALQTLDAVVAGAVESPPAAVPPAAPTIGSSYIVAEGATDAWAGKSQCVAAWTSGGWRFIAPVEGMRMFEKSSGTFAAFLNGGWELGILRGSALFVDGQQVIGPRSGAIASPSGGAVVDSEARAAIDDILNTLRQHGLIAA
jgi:hypothetical protein